MKIVIIDFRDGRRQRLHDVVRQAGVDVVVNAVAVAYDLPAEALDPDLVLLHVGPEQDDIDSIEDVLERFQEHSWIVCYSGTQPVEAAATCKSLRVAVFPAPVAMDAPGEDFLRVIQKVLPLVTERASLPEDGFRSVVTGFDALLEAKLDILASALSGGKPLPDHLTALKKVFATAFDREGTLLVQPRDPRSVARLRKMFFHEEPKEPDE